MSCAAGKENGDDADAANEKSGGVHTWGWDWDTHTHTHNATTTP